MLTPIKKQGDEHIYIPLQISIINWISVRYVDILRFVWMLIGSEITYGDALSSMKFTSKAITQMETRFFRRNRVTKSRRQRQKPATLRAAPLALCIGRTMKCKPTGILR